MHRENSPNRWPWETKKQYAWNQITQGVTSCMDLRHNPKDMRRWVQQTYFKDRDDESAVAQMWQAYRGGQLEPLQQDAVRTFLCAYDREPDNGEPTRTITSYQDIKPCRIATSGATPIRTYATDSFIALFGQRVTSWDLAAHRKWMSVVKFLLFYWRGQHLILKPYMLAEVVTVIQDWFRVYVFLIGLYIDQRAFGITLIFWFSLAYLELILFWLKTWPRSKDIQLHLSVILTFPVYKFITTMLFRQYAMMQNALVYAHNSKAKTIEYRLHTEAAKMQDDFPHSSRHVRNIPPSDGLSPRPGAVRNDPYWWRAWIRQEEMPLNKSK